MNYYYSTWATALGLEVRDRSFLREGKVLFTGDDDEAGPFLKGYEQTVSDVRREEIHGMLQQILLEERAYHLLWGTAIYLSEAKDFYAALKLSLSYQKRYKVNEQNLDHSYGLYMGNKWEVILLAVTDDPSDERMAILKIIDAEMRRKNCPLLDEKGNILPEFLGTAIGFQKDSRLASAYTPEVVRKLAAMAPGFKVENGRIVPDFQALMVEMKNGYDEIGYQKNGPEKIKWMM